MGTFYFSHSEALLPFLSLLGLYKDDSPLLHTNFEQNKGRQYRTSKIGSFSTGLAFVKFECDSDPIHRILTLHQEAPIQLPKCDQLLCDWDQFTSAYQVCVFGLGLDHIRLWFWRGFLNVSLPRAQSIGLWVGLRQGQESTETHKALLAAIYIFRLTSTAALTTFATSMPPPPPRTARGRQRRGIFPFRIVRKSRLALSQDCQLSGSCQS